MKGGSSQLKRSGRKVGLLTLNYLIKKNKPLPVLVHSRYSHVGNSRQADTTTSRHNFLLSDNKFGLSNKSVLWLLLWLSSE